jgi:tRNA-modifying protein YgfZ
MSELPHLAAIVFAGTDAQAFLQSQLSSNVAELAQGEAQLTSWCAINGRVIALGWLFRSAAADIPTFHWFVARTTLAATLAGLTKFKMRAKVSIQAPEQAVVGALSEPTAASADGFAIPGGRNVALAVGEAIFESEFHAQWLARDIAEKIPWNGGGERFLPQMLGLEHFGGLSLKKGCFPGQEVIARLHYKGALKRDLRVLTLARTLSAGSYVVQGGSDAVDVLQCHGSSALAVLSRTLPSHFALEHVDGALECQSV